MVFVWVIYTNIVLIIFNLEVNGFPQGATAEACETLVPRHVGTKPLDEVKSPYTFIASTNRYNDTTRQIKVELGGALFKGFLVVAVNPRTNERIGSWTKSKGMDSLPCSAITHTDSRLKIGATLVWLPPENQRSGEAIFLATIVRSFGTYHTGLIAAIPASGFFPAENEIK